MTQHHDASHVPADGSGRLPVIALVLAFLVGPLGAALGWWVLRGRPGGDRGRGLAVAAIGVGLVQTVVVSVLLATGALPAPGSRPEPTPVSTSTWTYPTTPPPSGPPVDPNSPTPTPVPPTATSLEEFVPDDVDSFDWQSGGEDSGEIEAGATQAEQGTFTSDGEAITAGMAEWASPDEARARAQANAAAQPEGSVLVAEGPIRSGAGYFWYYERDRGAVGTVFWYYGKFSAQFSGEPNEVQEFFLRFPK